MKKISIITLGCAKNESDTENLSGLLRKNGHAIVNVPSEADAIVVHTCSFIEAAKKESVQTILDAAGQKRPDAQLIVTGCMVQQHGKEMMEELPEVSAFLGTGQLRQVAEVLANPRTRFLDRRDPGGYTDPDAPRQRSSQSPTATLRLSEGCSHPCSFCVIPKLRGSLQSRSEDDILEEARVLADQGIEEFILIGQDTGDWGRDLFNERRLPFLLRKLQSVKGLRWLRLMYLHPVSMTDDLMRVFSESPQTFPYLDMPIQHIDDSVLSGMKRYLNEKETRRLIETLHVKAPDLSLRTTLIVGYPGETDRQFKNLLEFVKEGHFNHLGAFPYSQEENTPAAQSAEQIPDEVKQERLKMVTEAQYQVALEKSNRRLETVETVILEETEGTDTLGRTRMEAPEIDAVVRLPQTAARRGPFIQAKLTAYDAYEFTAIPV